MRFNKIIESICTTFNEAWNNWDLEGMRSFLSEDIELHSPKVNIVYPDNKQCIIIGKQAVLNYWIKLSELTGKFKVAKLKVEKHDREITHINRILGSETILIETLKLDEYGKIFFIKYEYMNAEDASRLHNV